MPIRSHLLLLLLLLVRGEGLFERVVVVVVHGQQRDAREEGEEALHHHQAPGALEHRGARPLRRRAAHVSLSLVRATDSYQPSDSEPIL